MGKQQTTLASNGPQFWGLGKKESLEKRMLLKEMVSFGPQQEKREEGAKHWRSRLNSIMEGFNSLPKNEGNFTE